MIHLRISTAESENDREWSPGGTIIDERDISLGDAMELVFGGIWTMVHLATHGSRLERLRWNEDTDPELALFYEYYIGDDTHEKIKRFPQSHDAFWYSFTLPPRGPLDSYYAKVADREDLGDLYDVLTVYAVHFEDTGQMHLSPEAQRHIERRKCGA